MHTNFASSKLSSFSGPSAIVSISAAKLCVLQLTIWINRSFFRSRAGSLMPYAYILPKAKFTALSNKAAAIIRIPVVIFGFVFISHRSAIDHHFGAFYGLLSFVTRVHVQLFEALPAILIDRELYAMTAQGGDLRTVGDKRRASVKSDLVDA